MAADLPNGIIRAVGGRSAGDSDRGALFSDDPDMRHRFRGPGGLC